MLVAMPLAVVGSGAIADYYYFPVLAADPHLAKGLNVHAGKITHPAVAEALVMTTT